MRTTKRILRQINQWKEVPMMVSGMYRLFTYIPWEEIPEEYKQFFDEKAREEWDEDLDSFKEKNIELDIEAEVKAILRVLVKKNITHSLGLIPIILADSFIYGLSTNKYQAKLAKIIKEYTQNLDIDRSLAEQLAIISTVDLLKEVIDSVSMELSFDIDEVTAKLMSEYKNMVDQKAKDIKFRALAQQADDPETENSEELDDGKEENV